MIPFHTTRIRVERPDSAQDSGDPYADNEESAPGRVVADRVRAVIVENAGGPAGPGDNELSQLKMRCDPCDIQHRDEIMDLQSGKRYGVEASHHYNVEPLSHVKVRLRRLDLGEGVTNNDQLPSREEDRDPYSE